MPSREELPECRLIDGLHMMSDHPASSDSSSPHHDISSGRLRLDLTNDPREVDRRSTIVAFHAFSAITNAWTKHGPSLACPFPFLLARLGCWTPAGSNLGARLHSGMEAGLTAPILRRRRSARHAQRGPRQNGDRRGEWTRLGNDDMPADVEARSPSEY